MITFTQPSVGSVTLRNPEWGDQMSIDTPHLTVKIDSALPSRYQSDWPDKILYDVIIRIFKCPALIDQFDDFLRRANGLPVTITSNDPAGFIPTNVTGILKITDLAEEKELWTCGLQIILPIGNTDDPS